MYSSEPSSYSSLQNTAIGQLSGLAQTYKLELIFFSLLSSQCIFSASFPIFSSLWSTQRMIHPTGYDQDSLPYQRESGDVMRMRWRQWSYSLMLKVARFFHLPSIFIYIISQTHTMHFLSVARKCVPCMHWWGRVHLCPLSLITLRLHVSCHWEWDDSTSPAVMVAYWYWLSSSWYSVLMRMISE